MSRCGVLCGRERRMQDANENEDSEPRYWVTFIAAWLVAVTLPHKPCLIVAFNCRAVLKPLPSMPTIANNVCTSQHSVHRPSPLLPPADQVVRCHPGADGESNRRLPVGPGPHLRGDPRPAGGCITSSAVSAFAWCITTPCFCLANVSSWRTFASWCSCLRAVYPQYTLRFQQHLYVACNAAPQVPQGLA